ncbi:MAG: hypothetical protein KGN74_12320 [Gemmatimonadota bacterium]|nr:hypothetical protein [Gemmatimonadota bacterium]
MSKRWFGSDRRRSPGGLAASVAIHLAIVLLLAQMVFRYPLSILVGYSTAEHIKPETVNFVRVRPLPPASVRAPAARSRAAPKAAQPAPLIAPTAIPTQIPAPIAGVVPPAQAAGGTGTGQGVPGGTGVATGVIPAMPDSRIRVAPGYFEMPTKTPAEKIDSIVADLYGDMLDSLEAVSHQRKPGDWTWTKDGKKYGWDQQGIQLGKFMIPNALFALLPLKLQANPTLSSRYDEGMREDLLFHARMSITEDEFKAAIKRIRDRNEKLHEERVKAREARADSSSH